MNPITVKTQVVVEATLVLNEQELGALDAIFGYSPEAFLKAFKEQLGAAYVEPYEDGVRSLHASVRKVTGPALSAVHTARKELAAVKQSNR